MATLLLEDLNLSLHTESWRSLALSCQARTNIVALSAASEAAKAT